MLVGTGDARGFAIECALTGPPFGSARALRANSDHGAVRFHLPAKAIMNFPVQPIQAYSTPQGNFEPDDSIEWGRVRDFLTDNWGFITAIMLLVTCMGAGFAMLSKPVYQISVLVQVENPPSSTERVLGDLNKVFDLKAASAPELEILRSRMVVAKAVDNSAFYIDVDPKRFPVVGDWMSRGRRSLSTLGWESTSGYAWGTERADVPVFNVPADLEDKKFALEALDADRFRLSHAESGVVVEGPIGRTVRTLVGDEPLEVKVDKLQANAGTEFVLTRRSRMKTIERLQRDLAIEEKGKQSGVIGIALKSADPKKAMRLLNEIAAQYLQQNQARSAESAAKALSFVEMQLPKLKQTLEDSESRYNEVRSKSGTVNLSEEATGLLQLTVTSQKQLTDLNQRRAELLTRYEAAHPSVMAIDQQIAAINRDQARVNTKIKALPKVEQDVLRLSRDVKVNTDVYTAVLSTAQQLRLSSASMVGNVRLLDSADIPGEPVAPKRSIIIPIAGAAGAALGMLLAFLRKRARGRVLHPDDVEDVVGQPVTAAIPHSDIQIRLSAAAASTRSAPVVLSAVAPYDLAVEGLHRFRSAVEFSMRNTSNNIIVITGPTSGVGKSFLAVNFAGVLASTGHRTLLIDGDLRTGALHCHFGLERGAGLMEALTGRAALETVIHRDAARNIDFLSTGELCANPSDKVGHQPFGNLLSELSGQYDYIVIDTAPVLLASHTLEIARHAGATFNIVRRGVTRTSDIEATIHELSQVGVTVTGTVFNDWKIPASREGYGYTEHELHPAR
jgi:tyrosine-protein kinase Etk/Wzc